MATASISTLLPLVQLPRCPEAVQLQALRLAARRFCLDTECWREALDEVAAVADQEEYALSPEYDDTRLLRLYSVLLDDVELAEDRWSFEADGTLVLDPAPAADGILLISAVYLPGTGCGLFPDWLLDRWGEAIAAGAECRLKETPENARDPVPWYDPAGAQAAQDRYGQAVFEAKSELLVGRRSGEVHAIIPEFYV